MGAPLGSQEGGLFARDLCAEEGSETGISFHRGPVENLGGGGGLFAGTLGGGWEGGCGKGEFIM